MDSASDSEDRSASGPSSSKGKEKQNEVRPPPHPDFAVLDDNADRRNVTASHTFLLLIDTPYAQPAPSPLLSSFLPPPHLSGSSRCSSPTGVYQLPLSPSPSFFLCLLSADRCLLCRSNDAA